MPALWGLEGRPFLAGSDPGETLLPTHPIRSPSPNSSQKAVICHDNFAAG